MVSCHDGKVLDVIAAWQLLFGQLFSQSVAIASGAAHARISAWPAHQRSSWDVHIYLQEAAATGACTQCSYAFGPCL